ncbi:MAG: PilZ domain-containing protein [Syntrophus sp. (in: bacteria)]|nr:PilZ domain-containing protein [Syntrophus sp. (in: bacteria)]
MTDKIYINKNGKVDKMFSSDAERKHVRFPVHISVEYGDEADIEYQSFILNASKGGIFIGTDKILPENTKIVMSFYIPPKIKFLGKFTGTVVWTNLDDPGFPKGMGVKFIDFDEVSMQIFDEFLQERRHLLNELV